MTQTVLRNEIRKEGPFKILGQWQGMGATAHQSWLLEFSAHQFAEGSSMHKGSGTKALLTESPHSRRREPVRCGEVPWKVKMSQRERGQARGAGMGIPTLVSSVSPQLKL